jgi:hypothetical protein
MKIARQFYWRDCDQQNEPRPVGTPETNTLNHSEQKKQM